jgi:4-amino-4-deoxy-L-arabinose transferase-like glycosyltransferase
VTQTDNPPVDANLTSLAARLFWIVLILATLYICYFHKLGAIGLTGPDEPRYAWIARDMAETGDWVTPRLYGKPWFEKPVLYYWGAALSFKLFGVSETAARLPSAVAALLATLAMAWLAWRRYGGEAARWLLLLLPTTVGMIGFSHAAATDMPFAGTLSVAMVCVAVILGLVKNQNTPILPRTPWLALLLFGFFLGLAVLAKGPAAIILSGGAVFFWAVFTKRWRDVFRCLHPVAIASFCLTALPWYILCARRNPDFFRIFIIEHNFKRYLTPEFQHIQPFWFYIPIILAAMFPWTILLVPVVNHLFEKQKNREFELFLASFPLVTLVFFSISRSKLPGYILPAIPPLALLTTNSLCSALSDNKRWLRWAIVALGICLLALGLAFLAVSNKLSPYTGMRPSPIATQIAMIATVSGLIVVALGMLRRSRIACFAVVVSLLLLIVSADVFLQEIDPGLTARFATQEAGKLWPEFSIQKASGWRLKRSLAYQLDFYAHSALPEWQPNNPKPDWLFVEPIHVQDAEQLGFECPLSIVYPAVLTCRAKDTH